MAQNCDTTVRTEQLELKHLELRQSLLDLVTKPQKNRIELEHPMSAILPYFPYANKVNLLPISFDRNTKAQGLIFFGDDLRSVECVNIISESQLLANRPPHYGGFSSHITSTSRSNQNAEVIVHGNTIIPFSQLPEYYFEITIGILKFISS
jgi:hypothetical protein